MANISSTLNDLLSTQKSQQIGQTAYSFDRVNEFLKEAYQIHTRTTELLLYLRSIRRPYLSTAPPPRQTRFSTPGSSTTHHGRHSNRDDNNPHRKQQQQQQTQQIYLNNTQRDAIDAEAKSTHRDISAAITRLAQAEKVRGDTETALVQQKRRKRGFGALGAWASGATGGSTAIGGSNGVGGAEGRTPEEEEEDGRRMGLRACREAVIWFLSVGLEGCGRVQSGMMEVRIRREREKSKGVLSLAGAGSASLASPGGLASPQGFANSGGSTDSGMAGTRAGKGYGQGSGGLPPGEGAQDQSQQQQLSEEQMQLFAEENRDMLKQYQDRLGQVRAAESSLLEISSLQSTLASNLSIQSTHIDALVQDSYTTAADVAMGNTELKKASERRSVARLVFLGTLGVCAWSCLWDLVF